MENGENSSSQELVIEGPEVLEPEQNIYDQAPFNTILPQFQLSRKDTEGNPLLPIESFRGVITKIASNKEGDKTPRELYLERLPGYHLRPDYLLRDYRYKLAGSNQMIGMQVGSAVIACIEALEEYPYWDEYIAKAVGGKTYFSDGSKNPNSKDTLNGYGEWLKAKIERVQKIRSSAVKIVVGESFDESSESVLAGSGKGRKNKQYRFLDAENLRIK